MSSIPATPSIGLTGDWNKREPTRISAGLRCGASCSRICARALPSRASPRVFTPALRGFTRAAVLARAATGIDQVALSGGCMHNRRLVRLLRAGLEAQGFEVFQHVQVSPGDGGLSYGQAVVAAAITQKLNWRIDGEEQSDRCEDIASKCSRFPLEFSVCLLTLNGLAAVRGLDLRQNTVLSAAYCALPLLSLPLYLLALGVRKLLPLQAVLVLAYIPVYSALNWRTCAELGYCGSVDVRRRS